MSTIEVDPAAQSHEVLEQPLLFVVKRDGRTLRFDDTRIRAAVRKAFVAVHGELTEMHMRTIRRLIDEIDTELAQRFPESVKIYEIQSVVEHVLLDSREYDVARAYIDYRVQRDFARSIRSPACSTRTRPS